MGLSVTSRQGAGERQPPPMGQGAEAAGTALPGATTLTAWATDCPQAVLHPQSPAPPTCHPLTSSPGLQRWSCRKGELRPDLPSFAELSTTQPVGNRRECRRVRAPLALPLRPGPPGCRQLRSPRRLKKFPEAHKNHLCCCALSLSGVQGMQSRKLSPPLLGAGRGGQERCAHQDLEGARSVPRGSPASPQVPLLSSAGFKSQPHTLGGAQISADQHCLISTCCLCTHLHQRGW